ncbi:MAG TPA: Ig-like domain-containing protein, partial [Longimicrobiales bacterium]
MTVRNGRIPAIGKSCGLAACVLLLVGAACGSDDGLTSASLVPPRLAALVAISPNTLSLEVDSARQVTATAWDDLGNVLDNHPVTWSSSDTTVASVSPGGLVTALAAGSATVRATVDGKTAISAVLVRPSPSAPLPPANPGGWPDNEPSGLTPLVAADGSTKYFFGAHPNVGIGGKWSDATIYPAANNGTRVQVVADPQSKYGSVVQKWTFTGEQSGFNGEYDWQGGAGFGNANGYKEMYFRIVFKFDPGWQWEVAHTQKLFYFATNRTNQSGGGNANSFFLSVDKDQIDFVDQANPGTATTSANGDGS